MKVAQMSEKVARFEMECQSCLEPFNAVYPIHDGREFDYTPELYTKEFDRVNKTDNGILVDCPHCGELQADSHTVDYLVLKLYDEDDYEHYATLFQQCSVCNERIGVQNEYCRECLKVGLEYARQYLDEKRECPVCEQMRFPCTFETHHTSYIPEDTMGICQKCHGRIHHSKGTHELEPDISRKEWKERR